MSKASRDEVWDAGTVYLRHFDKEGRSHVQEHACWNMDKFKASAQKAAIDAGGRVEQVTENEYQLEKKK